MHAPTLGWSEHLIENSLHVRKFISLSNKLNEPTLKNDHCCSSCGLSVAALQASCRIYMLFTGFLGSSPDIKSSV